MSTATPEQFSASFGVDPFLRCCQLRYLKNHLSAPQGKTTSCTFAFLIDQLPANRIRQDLFEKFGYDKHGDNLDCERLSAKLHSDWQNQDGHPAFRHTLLNMLQQEAEKQFDEESLFEQRLDQAVRLFRLNREARECLTAFYLVSSNHDFATALPNQRGRSLHLKTYLLARILWPYGLSLGRITKTVGHLHKLGLVDADGDLECHVEDFLSGMSEQPLCSSFYLPSRDEPIPLQWFDNKRDEIEMIKHLIRHRIPGEPLHILFYGKPGTGKTELARALADHCKKDLYTIKVNGDKTGRRHDTSFGFRCAAINACDTAVDTQHSIVLIDEADDMLNDILGFGKDSRKADVNELMDRIRTVCIWITNHSSYIDESTRRRFAYSLEFSQFTLKERLHAWRNCLEKTEPNIQPSPAELRSLAQSYRVNAGSIDLAVKYAVKLSGSKALRPRLEKILQQHVKLMDGEVKTRNPRPDSRYSIDALNIKGEISARDCVRLLARFNRTLSPKAAGEARPPRNMHLLMFGPPGTGKTEFAKYLAGKLNRELVIKTAADILSCWVGGTEKNIKFAFEEAEREQAILFFDEIEGLLGSRSQAGRSWEITQVNELLTGLERFHGIFLAATNLRQRVDPASIRRFNLKLEFDYLTAAGKRLLWHRYITPLIGKRLSAKAAQALAEIPALTPGDFKIVRQRHELLAGKKADVQAVLDDLRREIEHKQAGRVGAIGFSHHAAGGSIV